ncbi:MAG: cytochrome c nitrite reductase membrane subunit NrfH [Ignavibacteria bacterium]|nr:MAG: cytochrome c nitrite reductase membrane subunit NrfH [Ignavibacteria bacterium]
MEQRQSTNASILRKILMRLIPPDKWKMPVIILLGIFFGLGFYVIYISNAASYLSDDPKTCVNCHVMYPQYATWERGSHGRVATCNDCHVPQDNLINKYLFKANDGLRHATYFTMRWEPQVIQIKEAGKNAVQENCIRCHTNLVHPIGLRAINNKNVQDQTEKFCWDCHRETPHGRIHSLSSTPYANVPQLKPSISEWLENFTQHENQKLN